MLWIFLQVELVSSSDDEYSNLFTAKTGLPQQRPWQQRRRRRRTVSQPSLSQVHHLEQELSRRYEVSKEVELSILGPVPSILESGRMANTSSEIERSLRQVSACYAQRCQLRHQLRARLDLPTIPPVPVMTFDRFHNLVPKVGAGEGTQANSTNSANKIKLDNMEIEVSNEIMAMIYYRALMSKFERLHGGQGEGRRSPVLRSKSVPGASHGHGQGQGHGHGQIHGHGHGQGHNQGQGHGRGLGLGHGHGKGYNQGQSTQSENQVRYVSGRREEDEGDDEHHHHHHVAADDDNEDNEELDSSSETDISRLDLSSLTTREMRLRSLQRYSPRLRAPMLPVLETEDERYMHLEVRHSRVG